MISLQELESLSLDITHLKNHSKHIWYGIAAVLAVLYFQGAT